ncbi:MAG: hypothetical protein JWM68_4293 [Verrucomicrobiales bacterium]|nr:hypothetical protein [Verrucomicrobiales bacterium]
MRTSRHIYWLWLAAFALGVSVSANAQQRRRFIEEPQWLKLRVSEVDAGVYAEGTFEETSFDNGSTTISHNRVFIGPSMGLNLAGSIYHPNLFRFVLNTQGSYGWSDETITTPTSTRHRSQMEYLGRVFGSADIFANKPLRGNVFGSYDHSFRDYDFFNRVTVDSSRYGGRVNYNEGPFSVGVSYSHREESASGLIGMSDSKDDVAVMQLRHTRVSGSTSLDYSFNQYTRADLGRSGEGSDHTITLADSEKFGSRDQFDLNTSASYFRRNFSSEPSDEINGHATLNIEHRPTLNSYYDVAYDRYGTGDFTSDNYYGQAQLRHQLYESLTSTLIAQAANNEVSDALNSGYTRRFGVGFSEGYTKHIGTEHRVTLNTSLMVEHVDQETISRVKNERHAFNSGAGGAGLENFFLNLPNVMGFTIVVTDSTDAEPAFVRGIDYDVTTLGPQTLIERLPGSRIASGSTVLVDYQVIPTGAGSYDSLNELFQIRFDLFKNLWGLYARVNLYDNNAPMDLRVQRLMSYNIGSDVTWRWLRAGAEYEIYDSNFSDYRSFRLFQSFAFRPDPDSSLGINFSEAWTDYTDANRKEQNYRFITLYHRSLTSKLRLDVNGGIHIRRGDAVDQTLATFRPGIDYTIGKTSIRAEYDYEHQLFLDREERSRHMFILRIRRVF